MLSVRLGDSPFKQSSLLWSKQEWDSCTICSKILQVWPLLPGSRGSALRSVTAGALQCFSVLVQSVIGEACHLLRSLSFATHIHFSITRTHGFEYSCKCCLSQMYSGWFIDASCRYTKLDISIIIPCSFNLLRLIFNFVLLCKKEYWFRNYMLWICLQIKLNYEFPRAAAGTTAVEGATAAGEMPGAPPIALFAPMRKNLRGTGCGTPLSTATTLP